MLPTNGAISTAMIRKELGKTGPISLGSAECRKLAGKPNGSIKMSDFYGKSNSIKYDNHLIHNQIFDSGGRSFVAKLPNIVINGTIKVVAVFNYERIRRVGAGAKTGKATIMNTIISGTDTVTREITLENGAQTINCIVNNLFFERSSSTESWEYKTNIKIYFTGEVEA